MNTPTNQPVAVFQAPDAVILAGGLGTRLREAVPDLPKCMAPVAGQPFLFYVINYLRMQGVQRIVFSLGYKHEVIEQYLTEHFPTLQYECVIEQEPLGTGGAIQFACKKINSELVLIANGDTLFEVDIERLVDFHEQHQAECTLALKPMNNFERYGVVETNDTGRVLSFREKQFYTSGNINGGLYLLHRNTFLDQPWPLKFSFEKDYLEKKQAGLFAMVQDHYFIDIGIPQDFELAQLHFSRPPLDLSAIHQDWTLFLDRDGVINEDKDGSYIFTPDEFVFTKGAPALFEKLSKKFGRIIIITNQRGVGRGLMTEQALTDIHKKMVAEVRDAGGQIDAIYYATLIHNDDTRRKPNPGMAYHAKKLFPAIDLSKSIMVGNNISDMQFGRNAGTYTVFLKTTRPQQTLPHPAIDLAYNSLADFADSL